MRQALVVGALTICVIAPLAAQHTLSSSDVWYAGPLRQVFPTAIPIHSATYAPSDLPVHPTDITTFDVTTEATGGALSVTGTVRLGAVEDPFVVIDGAQGHKYMLFLQAFLVSPNGRVVWKQNGFPQGGAWVSASGDSKSFILINSYRGPTSGYTLWILAAGDPIFSDEPDIRAVIGAKRIQL